MFAAEYFVGDFTNVYTFFMPLFCHGGVGVVEAWQAVQIQYVRVAGAFHQFFGYTVWGQQFDTFGNQVFFTHRCPDIAIDDIGAFYCVQIIGDIDFGAGFTGYLFYFRQNLLVNTVNQCFWPDPYEMHAHFGTAVHPCIAHVVAHIAGEHYFYLIERFGYMFFDGQHVRQDLCRVVGIGQAIKHRYTGMLGQFFYHRLVKTTIFNTVKESAQYLCGIFQRFFFTHLRAARIQIGHMGSFIMGRHLKAASGTGGCFLKQQYNIFVFQVVFMNPRTFFRFQITGQIQQIANLTRCKIHQC